MGHVSINNHFTMIPKSGNNNPNGSISPVVSSLPTMSPSASTNNSTVQSIITDLNRGHANEVIFCPIQNILKDAMREHYQEKQNKQKNRYGTNSSIKDAEDATTASTNATPRPLRRTAILAVDGKKNVKSFQSGRQNDPEEDSSDCDSPKQQNPTQALHMQKGLSKNTSSFQSWKYNKSKNKGPMSLNRISACGIIETIVYKNKDGTENSYKGKLKQYSMSSERMLLGIASAIVDENSVVDRSATTIRSTQKDEGREDIETGIVHYRRSLYTNSRSDEEEDRDDPSSFGSSWEPFLSSHFSKMKKKKVRFCFDHSSSKHADNFSSSICSKKTKPKGIMKMSPLPFSNDGNNKENTSSSICSTNSVRKTKTKRTLLPLSNDGSLNGITKKTTLPLSNDGSLCSSDKEGDSEKINFTGFLVIAVTVAIMIVVLLFLTYFLRRVQRNADQERDGGT